jgi:peptidyl-prolyl cis-trans isomerase SurA
MWATLVVLVAGSAAAVIPLKTWWEESRVVARVNGEPVTRGALQRMLSDRLMLRELEQELGGRKAGAQEMQRLALRELIVRRLFLQEAARRGFTVPDQGLDRAVVDRRGRFKDAQAFQEWLAARGLDDKTLREDLRTEILMARVQAILVEGVRPTDQDIQAYYDTHKQELVTPEEFHLRIIAVNDRAVAEDTSAALLKGADISRLARERSTGFRANQGGDVGWVGPQFLPPFLWEAVQALKVGGTSPPLQGKERFYIIRVEARRPGRSLTMAEARPEIERRLLGPRQQQAIQAWLVEQEKKAKIEVFL